MYSKIELEEAQRSLISTLHKCEKSLLKIKPGSSQHTLLERRIDAFKIAITLIDNQLDAILQPPLKIN